MVYSWPVFEGSTDFVRAMRKPMLLHRSSAIQPMRAETRAMSAPPTQGPPRAARGAPIRPSV